MGSTKMHSVSIILTIIQRVFLEMSREILRGLLLTTSVDCDKSTAMIN